MGDVKRDYPTETRETIGGINECTYNNFEISMQLVDLGLVTFEEAVKVCKGGEMPMDWLELLAEKPVGAA